MRAVMYVGNLSYHGFGFDSNVQGRGNVFLVFVLAILIWVVGFVAFSSN